MTFRELIYVGTVVDRSQVLRMSGDMMPPGIGARLSEKLVKDIVQHSRGEALPCYSPRLHGYPGRCYNERD